ncbi:AIPR family protein [Bacillus timonensis]|uniref:AIPR family protein n=1 Tax=Bacillus timonensis TaxID=1033734 RepID=UPI000289FB45|nr:AIPR family protein [Bacillus timonensis]
MKKFMTVNIKADLREFWFNDKKCLIGVISGKELLNVTFPNNPNSREYMDRKNKNVPEMIKTLKNDPEYFLYKNNGIRLIAEDYTKNENGTFSLFFTQEQGIFNGSHTSIVNSKYGRSNSYVLLFVFFNIPFDKIPFITISNNSTTPIKEISRGEKLGKYEWIKKILPKSEYQITYKESDTFEIDVATVLQIAGIYQVDNKKVSFVNKDYMKFRSYLRTNIIKKHNDGKVSLNNTSFILKDLVDFYISIRSDEECISLIKKQLKGKGWLNKGKICNFLMMNIINSLNFAFKISPKTFYPYYLEGYDIQQLLHITKKVFPKIVDNLQLYENNGLKVTEICRENNIYSEIQNEMLQHTIHTKTN